MDTSSDSHNVSTLASPYWMCEDCECHNDKTEKQCHLCGIPFFPWTLRTTSPLEQQVASKSVVSTSNDSSSKSEDEDDDNFFKLRKTAPLEQQVASKSVVSTSNAASSKSDDEDDDNFFKFRNMASLNGNTRMKNASLKVSDALVSNISPTSSAFDKENSIAWDTALDGLDDTVPKTKTIQKKITCSGGSDAGMSDSPTLHRGSAVSNVSVVGPKASSVVSNNTSAIVGPNDPNKSSDAGPKSSPNQASSVTGPNASNPHTQSDSNKSSDASPNYYQQANTTMAMIPTPSPLIRTGKNTTGSNGTIRTSSSTSNRRRPSTSTSRPNNKKQKVNDAFSDSEDTDDDSFLLNSKRTFAKRTPPSSRVGSLATAQAASSESEDTTTDGNSGKSPSSCTSSNRLRCSTSTGRQKKKQKHHNITKTTLVPGSLALAKKEVLVAAAAVAAATAEEVEATITALTTATAAFDAATVERDAAKVAAREAAIVAAREAARAAREVAAERGAAKKEKKEGEEAEKIISAIASEYRKIQAVLERGEEKKRPLAAATMRIHKRLKKESDRIRDITPNWIKKDRVLHELHQQLRASDLEREQLVAKTKNEKNKSEKMVASEMKKWLDCDGVTDLASINKKRKELEEQARIQRIDDRFESDYLDYGKKMNKFHNLTIPIMQHYKWVEAPAMLTTENVQQQQQLPMLARPEEKEQGPALSSSEPQPQGQRVVAGADSTAPAAAVTSTTTTATVTATAVATDTSMNEETTTGVSAAAPTAIAWNAARPLVELITPPPQAQQPPPSAPSPPRPEEQEEGPLPSSSPQPPQQGTLSCEADVAATTVAAATTTPAVAATAMASSRDEETTTGGVVSASASISSTSRRSHHPAMTGSRNSTSGRNRSGRAGGRNGGNGNRVAAPADHQILCGIFHGVCKELKAIQEAFYVSPQLGKYLHDIMPRDSRTIAVKIKGVFFRKIIKLCNSYLDFLNMIGEAITGGLGTRGNKRIMKVLAYQVNREKLFPLMNILDLICTEAHVNHSLYCHVNGALQKELLIERVPKFIDCKSLFLIDGDLLSTLTKVEFDFEVIAHELIWKRHLYNIQAFKENCCPLPADTAKLNLNIANATMEYVLKREKDGSYTKSRKKVLVFGITWCVIVFCTGASGVSYCWNGDLVLHKFNGTKFVDGLGHVFDRGQFDVNDELREVPQHLSEDGYSSVNVQFSSQFIPYIYSSGMRVATLQWAGILGSWYLLDETMDHLTGEKDKNGILHTQPASKQENIDRRPLQGLPPLVGGRSCLQ